ncbi:hypothetical protein WJX81_004624 [Elliptochloris bilobata]|uniref:Uncharacterized protein n=1 Tax=Elliptochloris bilobata TaxID=381761 RepID=A0AAW1RFK1_9CHLO
MKSFSKLLCCWYFPLHFEPMVAFVLLSLLGSAYGAPEFSNGSTQGAFVSADGTWLSEPVAVMRSTSGGKPMSALLRLSNPSYDAANNILTFGSQILPADSTAALPTVGGVSSRLVDDTKNGVAGGLLSAAPSAPLAGVGLFIDANSQALNKAGITKQIVVCFPSCGGGYGDGGGWRGDGWRGDGWRGDGWRGDRGGWRGDGYDGDRSVAAEDNDI